MTLPGPASRMARCAVLHVGWLLVAAVAWSRVRLRDHTWPQVVAGTALGAPLAAVTFLALA